MFAAQQAADRAPDSARRIRDLGLRMALGARPAEIQKLILGVSLGTAAVLALTLLAALRAE